MRWALIIGFVAIVAMIFAGWINFGTPNDKPTVQLDIDEAGEDIKEIGEAVKDGTAAVTGSVSDMLSDEKDVDKVEVSADEVDLEVDEEVNVDVESNSAGSE